MKRQKLKSKRPWPDRFPDEWRGWKFDYSLTYRSAFAHNTADWDDFIFGSRRQIKLEIKRRQAEARAKDFRDMLGVPK